MGLIRRRARFSGSLPFPSAPALPAAAVGLMLVLAGCGGGGGGGESGVGTATSSTSQQASAQPGDGGAVVFAAAGCGDCHTLAAAGSTGTTGPSLDGLKLDRETVVAQVRDGGGSMPAFAGKLTDAELGAVADFVAEKSGAGPSLVVSFEPDGTKLADCDPGDSSCYMQAFGNLAYDGGPEAALGKLAQEIAATPPIERVCHPLAHVIGAASLLHFGGNAGQALAAGNAVCGSGFYHGLLQSKLAGVPETEVAGVARSVCAGLRQGSSYFVYYQCVHGLGHGLMLYTRDDLPGALDLCHQLATDFDRISCSGGVFMENQQPSFGGPSKWLRKDNLLYPCDIVSQIDKTYCYLMVTSQILPRNGWDWQATADWCRRSDPDFVPYCFQSFGRDASGTSRQDPVGIRRLCDRAGDGRRECIFGGVRDILNNQPGDARARELCDAVAAADRSYCFFGIGSMVGAQYATSREREAACGEFASGKDHADCVEGAVSAARQTS